MNHCVPDFEMDDDYAIPASSTGLSRVRKSTMPEDEVMELLWQNGPVVMQSQNQRCLKKSPPSRNLIEDAVIPAEQSTSREIRTTSATAPQPEDVSATHLFMQEDEMASWLHYPLEDTSFDRDFCADFLYSAPCATATVAATTAIPVRTAPLPEPRPLPLPVMAARPPIPPVRMITTEVESSRFANFLHFSRTKGRAESGPSDSNNNKVVRESTVVDSNETPAMGQESRISQVVRSTGEIGDIGRCGSMSGAAVAGTSSAGGGGREMATGDMTVTSSPGGSGASASASASAEPVSKPQAENRKRKARQAAAAAADDETEFYSEDVEFESADTKKPVRGSTSAKRSRAAEVHNLSERRRRDRINEKMKALQELIPRCNKSDKASMLDEAIEYLKSLQMQVQMMSMGCSMVPMMFPGVQQYMPPMGMGMGMGMGMEMGMSRPMMPFPSPLPGSAPAAAAHLGPRYPMPAFHMQPVHAPDPSRIQGTNQSDPMLNSVPTQNLNHQQWLPNFADPYQRYIGLHQMQLPSPPQNQGMPQPSTSTPSTSGGAENQNLEHRQSGLAG